MNYSVPVKHKKRAPAREQRSVSQPGEIDLVKLQLYWSRVDVIAQIERHTSTRPFQHGRTWRGRCPLPECSSQHDALTIWPDLSKEGNHYYCRKCGKAGRLDTMLKVLHPEWSDFELLSNIGLLEDAHQVDEAAQARMSAAHRDALEQEQRLKHELELLTGIYRLARQALESHERPIAYNASRGISVEQARAYGLGYIPHLSELKTIALAALQHEPAFVRKWQGRIIFPLSGPDGQMTFAGRTVALWQPGMTPEEHKKAIEAYNVQFPERDRRRLQRVVKTSPCGWFGYDQARAHEEVAFVEGEYDALTLLISGIPAIAVARNFKAALVPISVRSAILALDNDAAGQASNGELAQAMERYGLVTRQVCPTGKDWNDMLIAGLQDEIVQRFQQPGPAPMASQGEQLVSVPSEQEEVFIPEQCADCGASIEQEDREFFFLERSASQVQCYCTMCRDPETGEPRQVAVPAKEEEQDVSQDREAESMTAPAHQLAPEEIMAAFTNVLPEWNVTMLPGAPTYELPAPAGEQQEDFWQRTARQIAAPPRYIVPDLDENGEQKVGPSWPIYNRDQERIGYHHGSKQYTTGKPMMSREAWAKRRAEQLAWRPDPVLFAHRKQP